MTPSFNESIEARLESAEWSQNMSSNILGKHRHQVKVKRVKTSLLSLAVVVMVGVFFSTPQNADVDPFLLDRSVSNYYSSVIEESNELLTVDTIYF